MKVPVMEEKIMVLVVMRGARTVDAVMDCASNDRMVTVLA